MDVLVQQLAVGVYRVKVVCFLLVCRLQVQSLDSSYFNPRLKKRGFISLSSMSFCVWLYCVDCTDDAVVKAVVSPLGTASNCYVRSLHGTTLYVILKLFVALTAKLKIVDSIPAQKKISIMISIICSVCMYFIFFFAKITNPHEEYTPWNGHKEYPGSEQRYVDPTKCYPMSGLNPQQSVQ